MGSGVSKDGEVAYDAQYVNHVKSEAAFSDAQKSRSRVSQGHKGQSGQSGSETEKKASRISRVGEWSLFCSFLDRKVQLKE